jgi:hypothetical protein
VQQIQQPQVKQVASQVLQVRYVACSDFDDEDLQEPGIVDGPDFDEDEVQEDFFGEQVASQEVQLLQVRYVACSDFADEDLREPGIIGVPDFDEELVQNDFFGEPAVGLLKEDFFGEPVVGLLVPTSTEESEDVVIRVPPVSEQRLDWCKTGDVEEDVNCKGVSWNSEVVRMSQAPNLPILMSVMKHEGKQREHLSDKAQQSVLEEPDYQRMDQQMQQVRSPASVRTEKVGISPRQGSQVNSTTTETEQGSASTEPSSPGKKRSPPTASSGGEPPCQERLGIVRQSQQQSATQPSGTGGGLPSQQRHKSSIRYVAARHKSVSSRHVVVLSMGRQGVCTKFRKARPAQSPWSGVACMSSKFNSHKHKVSFKVLRSNGTTRYTAVSQQNKF